MQLIKDVIYDAQPQTVTTYPSVVYVIKTCTPIQVEEETSDGKKPKTVTKYQCDVEVYEPTEYIGKLQEQNGELEAQMTQTQVALTEVYELLLG